MLANKHALNDKHSYVGAHLQVVKRGLGLRRQRLRFHDSLSGRTILKFTARVMNGGLWLVVEHDGDIYHVISATPPAGYRVGCMVEYSVDMQIPASRSDGLGNAYYFGPSAKLKLVKSIDD